MPEVHPVPKSVESHLPSPPETSDPQAAWQAWMQPVLQMVREGVVAVDPGGCIRYLNPAAEEICGWHSAQALGKPVDDVFSSAEPAKSFLEALPHPGGTRRTRIINQAGEPVYLRISVPVPAMAVPDGRVFLVCCDRETNSVQQLQSNFVASITHEFRTPLSALNASVEFLLEEMANLNKNEIEELLRSIHMSVTGLQTLIDNLLESSSIEAGMFSIRKQAVDITQVVNEALQVMQPLILRRRQQISLDIAESLPPVSGDPTRIRQVLVNLLSNASKYGPINQVIQVGIALEAGSLRTSITDQGPGIPETDRTRLFKRFVRIQDRNGPQPGIGLGLAVVKSIVEAHGGKVGVESSLSGGSTFWFTIPVYGAQNESPDRG